MFYSRLTKTFWLIFFWDTVKWVHAYILLDELIHHVSLCCFVHLREFVLQCLHMA